jgi:hypothetical protein
MHRNSHTLGERERAGEEEAGEAVMEGRVVSERCLHPFLATSPLSVCVCVI